MKVYGSRGERSSVGYIVRLLNGASPWGFSSEQVRNMDRASRAAMDSAFNVSLRSYVDQWIESAKDAEGTDVPIQRTVDSLPNGYSESLREVLITWYRRNVPEVDVTPKGESVLILRHPRFEVSEATARETAIYWLRELLNHPQDSLRIARCENPNCRAYYVRKRLRKKQVKRGTYCGNCAGIGSVTRTKATRKHRKEDLIFRAAEVWEEFKPSRNHPIKSVWVAARVNRKLRPDMQITGKWVNQNRSAIEAEVESRKHAKS